MGSFATDVQEYLQDQLSTQHPEIDWDSEHRIAGTPVDVAGATDSRLYLIELEWRRADPADNAAKLFRHLDEGTIHRKHVVVFQLFTEYYELTDGDDSSKRKNAEFVGRIAADTIDSLTYQPLEFNLDPPKRGEERPPDWETAASECGSRISERVSADVVTSEP